MSPDEFKKETNMNDEYCGFFVIRKEIGRYLVLPSGQFKTEQEAVEHMEFIGCSRFRVYKVVLTGDYEMRANKL